MPYQVSKEGRVAMMGLYLLVGIIIGFLVAYVVPKKAGSMHPLDWLNNPNIFVRQKDTRYAFISPLLDSEIPTQELSQQLHPYEKSIVADAKEIIKKYPADKVSFYYKDLTTASWVGIGENEKYIPASLLKLPLAIAYYKLAEADPTLLEQTITPSGPDQNEQRNIPATKVIEIGKSYTVDELITTMLVESDNNALQALYQYKHDSLKDIFADMKQQFPLDDLAIANADYVSPRSYSRFLLILYNASYLYRGDSEKLLKLLSRSTYKDGLVAGVPNTITVSHKFGERRITENGQTKFMQFHDCGIIYVPDHPYKLCVMSQGADLKELQEITKQISAAIYGLVRNS